MRLLRYSITGKAKSWWWNASAANLTNTLRSWFLTYGIGVNKINVYSYDEVTNLIFPTLALLTGAKYFVDIEIIYNGNVPIDTVTEWVRQNVSQHLDYVQIGAPEDITISNGQINYTNTDNTSTLNQLSQLTNQIAGITGTIVKQVDTAADTAGKIGGISLGLVFGGVILWLILKDR